MSEPMVLTNTYDIQLADRTVQLRITVAAQLRLKKKFNAETMDFVMSAATDIEKLIAVFDEALSFNGNNNDGLTGEELYDMLVDSGIKGTDAFAALLFNVANTSGILSDKQSEQVRKGISKMINFAFESIENGAQNMLKEDKTVTAEEGTNTVPFPKQS